MPIFILFYETLPEIFKTNLSNKSRLTFTIQEDRFKDMLDRAAQQSEGIYFKEREFWATFLTYFEIVKTAVDSIFWVCVRCFWLADLLMSPPVEFLCSENVEYSIDCSGCESVFLLLKVKLTRSQERSYAYDSEQQLQKTTATHDGYLQIHQ